MKFKKGTIVQSLVTEMIWALYVADLLHEQATGEELVVTSVNDGHHRPGSKHYTGEAADLRIWFFTDETRILSYVRTLKSVLGTDFDVILETDHIHLEWDKKNDDRQ